MKKINILLILLSFFFLVVTIAFSWWWNENAPYCCTHICGATHTAMECWGSFVIPILVILTITPFTMFLYGFVRESLGDRK